VQGSTQLRARHGDRVADEILHDHEGILRRAVEAHGGDEAAFPGDGFMLTFASPADGLRCAISIQQGLQRYGRDNADRRVRVRTGLHQGEATERDGTFYRQAVNAASRVMSEAAGGQILVTAAVHDAVEAAGFSFVDRELYWLRGFPDRWRLYEVEWGRDDAGGAIGPGQTPFVGRERERADLRRAVEDARVGRGSLVLVTGEAGGRQDPAGAGDRRRGGRPRAAGPGRAQHPRRGPPALPAVHRDDRAGHGDPAQSASGGPAGCATATPRATGRRPPPSPPRWPLGTATSASKGGFLGDGPERRSSAMTPDDPWLAAVWPIVRDQLPSAPATVLEVGCGSLGGFVPALLDAGYQGVGVDPEAPEGPDYRRMEFERFEPAQPIDCVVASLSLHHVADLGEALDRLQALLVPGGVLLVLEWAWERFDEPTARWCFARLAPPIPGAEPGWLHRHQERWAASGQPWDAYRRAWATEEGLHPGGAIVRGLDARFDRQRYTEGPYYFADLSNTSEAEEQAAIDTGHIQAGGIRYAAKRPDPTA
jgi:SAM-dependent methyltransferase